MFQNKNLFFFFFSLPWYILRLVPYHSCAAWKSLFCITQGFTWEEMPVQARPVSFSHFGHKGLKWSCRRVLTGHLLKALAARWARMWDSEIEPPPQTRGRSSFCGQWDGSLADATFGVLPPAATARFSSILLTPPLPGIPTLLYLDNLGASADFPCTNPVWFLVFIFYIFIFFPEQGPLSVAPVAARTINHWLYIQRGVCQHSSDVDKLNLTRAVR